MSCITHPGKTIAAFLLLAALLASITAGLITPAIAAAQTQSQPPSRTKSSETTASSRPFMRVVENDDDDTMRLDIAVRFFAPADGSAGPTIAMAGAIHIAEPRFYAVLQSFLEAQDLVMYEGVKPSGFGTLPLVTPETDAAKRKRTEMTIRFLASMLERTKSINGNYPDNLSDLVPEIRKNLGRRVADWVDSSQKDAWGNNLSYQKSDDGNSFNLTSLGADGKQGGQGPNADFSFADQKPLTNQEKGGDPGLQRRLAKALGLTFQLDAMNEVSSNFRNVDMSIDEIEAAIAKEGGDASFLFSMLDGSGFMAGVMKFGLAIIEKSPMMQAMAKITLMETMKTVSEKGMMNMRGVPGNMTAIFDVIIHQRNQVVIDEIKNTLREDRFGPDSTIAIIYGAGHLDDLQSRLTSHCKYKPVGGFWVTAMNVNLKDSGLTKEQIKMIRYMVGQMN